MKKERDLVVLWRVNLKSLTPLVALVILLFFGSLLKAGNEPELFPQLGHSDWVRSVAFSPDGQSILSGSSDNTLKLWSLREKKAILNWILLPGNEWLSWKPQELFYNSSLQGDEYFAVRFDNKNHSFYPLEWYRDSLKKDKNLFSSFSQPQPEIQPKIFRQFWVQNQKSLLGYGGAGGSLFVIALAVWIIVREKSDPKEIAKKFFLAVGYTKVTPSQEFFLFLFQEKEQKALAVFWEEEKETMEFNLEEILTRNPITKIYLLYQEKKPSSEFLQQIRQKRKNLPVIPLAHSLLKKALNEGRAEKALQDLEDPFLVWSDPYSASKLLYDPIWFYGRENSLKEIPRQLMQGQHVGLFGLRKVGKTSVLLQLQQRFSHSPVVLLDCQAYGETAKIFFEAILEKLRKELSNLGIKKVPFREPEIDGQVFRKQLLVLFELWKKTGRDDPFLLIFDEIDKLFLDRDQKQNETILAEYVALFRILRGLAQEHRCLVTLVVAYRREVNRFNLLPGGVGENPMFKAFKEESLGFLTTEESEKMIREIGLWKEIHWEKEAAEQVFHYCGGHPLVTRYFASMACEEGALKKIDSERVEETLKEVIRTFGKNDIGNYFKESLWNFMREGEKTILTQACQSQEEGFPAGEVPLEFEEELANLESFGLIKNEKGRLKMSSFLFQKWLERRV